MFRTFLAAAVLASAAAAQTTDDVIFVSTPPQFGGTIDAATGIVTPPSAGGVLFATVEDIYDNTCFGTGGNYFSNMAVTGQTRLDEGRIPSSTSPVPAGGGVLNSYRVTQLRFGYATNEVDPSIGGPGVSIQISLYADYDIGTGVAAAGTPLATYVFNGLNGSTTGNYAGWLYTVNINPATLTIAADADGIYDGSPALDTFGYSFTLPTFTAGKSTGPYLAGAPPPACPMGDGTYYQNPGVGISGTGLDNSNTYTRDTAGVVANFVGTANYNGGYYLALVGELDDCNNNDVPDATDIANLTSMDVNADGIPDECAAISYCTAGTTSNGCNASITGTGTPSASAGSGFTLTVANVEGGQSGILFYGITGPKADAWGSGTSFLCVKSPLERMGVQNSGGTLGACDGLMSIDWNAYIAGNPLAVGVPFAGGETVYAQAWFRDPPAPKTTSLSDALQFMVQP